MDAVLFARRVVATPEQVRQIQASHGPAAEQILREEFDGAEAESSFAILLRPRWTEHLLTVQFRDGDVAEVGRGLTAGGSVPHKQPLHVGTLSAARLGTPHILRFLPGA